MKKEEKRDYRPKVHFTPPAMWINDPNGMVYVDGVYHLFYQHYPEDTVWGPMHWGHAISGDLLHWDHLPIALYPDELGYIFSGSCVYDYQNTSGLGAEGKAPLVALYTSHDGTTQTEHQSMAYSTDYVHFEKYRKNPVISNPGIKDFRDPKVFRNSELDCWSMVLAATDRVNFYCSRDLKSWEKTGEFLIGHNGIKGICECPDCFPVKTEEGIKWILIISMIIETENKMANVHKTQYFIGTFDGRTFIEAEKAEGPLWLNYGPDHYAGVTFQNMDRPVLMGWANNWAYGGAVPTEGYRGQMSLASEISLKKTPLGYRAAFRPLGLEQLRGKGVLAADRTELATQSFGLEAEGSGQGRIILSNAIDEELIIEITGEEIIVDRTKAGRKDFHEKYGLPEFCRVSAARYQKGDYRLELIFDVSLLELFAEDGLIPVTMSVYPERPYETLHIEGEMKAYIYPL